MTYIIHLIFSEKNRIHNVTEGQLVGALNLNSSQPKTRTVLSVYGYTNYRVYLKDFYELKKSGKRGYSYRAFSKAAGISSPNFLKLVIDDHRSISKTMIEKFIDALGLENQMAEYFRLLVQMNQVKEDEKRALLLDKLKKLLPYSKKHLLNLNEYQYLSHWIYPVLRELVDLEDFNSDPYWISNRLRKDVDITEIKRAFDWLLKVGFVEKNQTGRYVNRDSMVISSDEVKSLAIRNYHREMLDEAKECLETLEMGEREYGALTMSLPESALPLLKQKMKIFRQDLHRWASEQSSEDSPELITQVNIQMYPHTKKRKHTS